MSFHDVQLDEDVERGAQGGPGFKTTITQLSSGFEFRNIDWEKARGRWDISYGLDDKVTHEAVLAFFYARFGRAHTFRFKDWTDFVIGVDATDTPQAIGTGDGAQTQFQASRLYTSGAFSYTRPITKLVSGTVRVFLDGVEQFADFTLDLITGVVTFTAGAPGGGVVVGLINEFHAHVRFDIDQLDLRAFFDGNYSLPEIPLLEVRETLVVLS